MKTNQKIAAGVVMTFFFSLMMTVLFAQKPNGSFSAQAASQEQSLPMPPNAPAPPPPPPLCPDFQSQQAPPPLNLPDLTPEQQAVVEEALHLAAIITKAGIKKLKDQHEQK